MTQDDTIAVQTIRPAFSLWPEYNRKLRDVVATLTDEQLALRPSPERWPIWATIGHLACQRVFGLCDFAGEPGADTTPFPNAGFNCPGDDDLETVYNAEQLVAALDSTFAIVENCLDTWTLDSLKEVIDRSADWAPHWVRSRGKIILSSFAHDVHHIGELNEVLGRAGLPRVDIWEWEPDEQPERSTSAPD
jgi:hypothetical protein